LSIAKIKVRLTDTAAAAIIAQRNYYSIQENRQLAERWVLAVLAATESLRQMPERGSPCNFRLAKLRLLRRLPVPGFESHLVFYQYRREEQVVRVVHVLHGARDIENVLIDL
jgi:plasmid stabilization system protein ParE